MITRDIAIHVMERLRSGKKQLSVAHEFGVSERTISAIVSGKHCCWRADWKPPTPKVVVQKPPKPVAAPKERKLPKPTVERKPIDETRPKRGKSDSGCKFLPSTERIVIECAAIRQMWSQREYLSRAGISVDHYEFPVASFRLFVGAA
jgi:hypothetical protein